MASSSPKRSKSRMPFYCQPNYFCDDYAAMTIAGILSKNCSPCENPCDKTYYVPAPRNNAYQVCQKTTNNTDTTTLNTIDLCAKRTSTTHTCVPLNPCADTEVEPTPDLNLNLLVEPNIRVAAPGPAGVFVVPDPEVTFNVEIEPEVVTRTEEPCCPATGNGTTTTAH